MPQTTTTATQANPVKARSRTLIESAFSELRALHDEDAIREIAGRYNAAAPPTTVVVLGEVKRGKSMLVNAIVGIPGLVPVDVDLCTPMPLRVTTLPDPARHARPEPVVEACRGGEVTALDPADIPVYSPGTGLRRSARELPDSVDIAVTAPDLAGLTIIDTPGVGGLDRAAVRYALSVAREAGVLIMVCDAATQITRPEMEVLRDALAVVGEVIVVVAQTDKNLGDWREIVDADRRLIAEHLGVGLPVIGVSSLRALAAADMPPGDHRTAVEADSGITELRKRLTSPAGRGRLRANAQGLRLAAAKLAMHRDRWNRRRGLLDPDDDRERIRLEHDIESLSTLRRQSRRWLPELNRDLSTARLRAIAAADRGLDDVKSRWEQELAHRRIRDLRRNPTVFAGHVRQDLLQVVEDAHAEMLRDIRRIHDGLLDGPGDWDALVEQAGGDLLDRTARGDDGVTLSRESIIDPSLLTISLAGGGSLASLVGTVGGTAALGPAAPIVAPVAMVVWLAVNVGFRKMRSGSAALRKWLAETVTEVRRAHVQNTDAFLAIIRTELQILRQEEIDDRMEKLEADLRLSRAAAARTEAERRREQERAERIVAKLTPLIADLDEQARALTGGRA